MNVAGAYLEYSSDGSSMISIKSDTGEIFAPYPGRLERVKRIKDLKLRDDDVMVFSYPKSGTHWVGNTVFGLLHKDKLEKQTWKPEFLFMGRNDLEQLNASPSPRILQSHLNADYFKKEMIMSSKARLIHVRRNLRDSLVSGYHFMAKAGLYKGTLDGLIELLFDRRIAYGDWFEHIESYRKLKEQLGEQLLLLSYDEMNKEPRKHVQMIADHIGIAVNEEEITKILELSSVHNMQVYEKSGDDGFLGTMRSLIYRKGERNDWKNTFTVAQAETFEAEYTRRIQQYENWLD